MAKYKVVREESLVRVKIPSGACKFLKAVPAHSFEVDGMPVSVPSHYKHGQNIGNTEIIVNRHFYGVSESDFGKTILATVKVVSKVADGLPYLLVDITKKERVDGVFPEKTLKIMPSIAIHDIRDGDIRIPMAGIAVIRFEDYELYVPERLKNPTESPDSVGANQ